MTPETITYVHKIKCLNCQLHYAVYSWHGKWDPCYCPECGTNGPYLHWVSETEEQVYELVPGASPLIRGDLSPAEKAS